MGIKISRPITNIFTHNQLILCPSCKQEIPVLTLRKSQQQIIVYSWCTKLQKQERSTLETFLQNLKVKSDSKESFPCSASEHMSEGIKYCINCTRWLCNDCVNSHDINHYLIDHYLDVKCQSHQEEYAYYCRNCHQNICKDCTGNHAKCVLIPLFNITLSMFHRKMSIIDYLFGYNEDILSYIGIIKEIEKRLSIEGLINFESTIIESHNQNIIINLLLNQLTNCLYYTIIAFQNHSNYGMNKLFNAIPKNIITIPFINEKTHFSRMNKKEVKGILQKTYKSINNYYLNNYLIQINEERNENDLYYQNECFYTKKQEIYHIDSLILSNDIIIKYDYISFIHNVDQIESLLHKYLASSLYKYYLVTSNYFRLSREDINKHFLFVSHDNYKNQIIIKKYRYSFLSQIITVLKNYYSDIIIFMELKNHSIVVAAFQNGSIQILKANTFKFITTLDSDYEPSNCIVELDNDQLAIASKNILRLWDLIIYKCVTVMYFDYQICSLCQLKNGGLALGLDDYSIRIHSANSLKWIATLRGNLTNVRYLYTLRDGTLISISDDSIIKFWDITN